MPLKTRTRRQEYYERASRVMPKGVSSNFRYWGAERTPIMERAEGGYVYDVDGNRLIDYRLGFGPIILGHAHGPVVERVVQAIRGGNLYAATTPWEIEVAERITRMCPGVERVRFANSGTEATMHALRVARAYTGRSKVIKFEGQYHGFHDYLLWSTYAELGSMGHPKAPIAVAASSGIPAQIRDLIYTLPYNDFELLERTVRQGWGDIATIIVEPVLGNCCAVQPLPGWLEHIRRLCDEYGMVMILDEVKTGFRLARGGAQEYFSITGDLVTYAKSLGNGFPIAAFGGKAEIMDLIGSPGVAHGGTYCGSVTGTAAASVVLEILEDGRVLEQVAERGRELQQGISEILTRHDRPHRILGHPSMFGIAFTEEEEVRDYRSWARSDHAFYERMVMALVERGVMPDPDSREPWFMCLAHSSADVTETLNALDEAVREAKK